MNKFIQSAPPPALKDLIEHDMVSIEDVLEDTRLPTLIERRDRVITRFLIKNIREILELAFLSGPDALSRAAYSTLMAKMPQVLVAAAETGMIECIAESVMRDEAVTSIALFVEFIEAVLRTYPEAYPERFGFIHSFLFKLDEYPVLTMFQSILTEEEFLIPFHVAVSDDGIAQSLSAILTDKEISESMKINVFKVLLVCSNNSILREDCLCAPVLENATIMTGNESPEYMDAQWNFIANIVCKSTLPILLPYQAHAATIVASDMGKLRLCQVAAMNFISTCIDISDDVCFLDMNLLTDALCGIIKNYPEHGDGMHAATNLIDTLVRHQEILNYLPKNILPLVTELILNGTSKNQFAHCLNLAQNILDVAKASYEVEQSVLKCEDFCSAVPPILNDYLNTLEAPYGGLPPNSDEESIEELYISDFHAVSAYA